jgi:hypothetical protein
MTDKYSIDQEQGLLPSYKSCCGFVQSLEIIFALVERYERLQENPQVKIAFFNKKNARGTNRFQPKPTIGLFFRSYITSFYNLFHREISQRAFELTFRGKEVSS